MSSWRLDSTERDVSAKPAPKSPASKQSTSTDDDEYDFGAPQAKQAPQQAPQKAASTSTSTAAGGSEPMREPDLFNPLMTSLLRVQLKRQSGQPFGFSVSYVAPGVFKVIKVTDDGPAPKLGIEKGMYLLSVDGQRIKSEADLNDFEKSETRPFRMAFAKRRPEPLSSIPFPPDTETRADHQYLLVRLDPTNGTRVGTGIGEKDGKILVTQVIDSSAGAKAGVQVGDRLVAVDETKVENRDNCKTLVQQSMGNPFDMLLERAPPKPRPPPPPPPPPPPKDPNEGDPTLGVPNTPEDVSIIMESKAKKTLVSIRHSKKTPTKKRPSKSPKGGVSPRSVRINKSVQSTKLHQTDRQQKK